MRRGIGLIETMRVRGGRLPFLERHLARLRRSLAELQLPPPPADVGRLERSAAGLGDCALRVEVRDGRAEVTTRPLADGMPDVIVAGEAHVPYPRKTTERDVFERALIQARRAGATDALFVTRGGSVAEGTTWNLCWWENDVLCTPAGDLGVLPGIGRGRLMELGAVREVRVPLAALAGRSLFLVNAVRGVVPLASLAGRRVPEDARIAELSRRFWPD